jgi:hypothetical protein
MISARRQAQSLHRILEIRLSSSSCSHLAWSLCCEYVTNPRWPSERKKNLFAHVVAHQFMRLSTRVRAGHRQVSLVGLLRHCSPSTGDNSILSSEHLRLHMQLDPGRAFLCNFSSAQTAACRRHSIVRLFSRRMTLKSAMDIVYCAGCDVCASGGSDLQTSRAFAHVLYNSFHQQRRTQSIRCKCCKKPKYYLLGTTLMTALSALLHAFPPFASLHTAPTPHSVALQIDTSMFDPPAFPPSFPRAHDIGFGMHTRTESSLWLLCHVHTLLGFVPNAHAHACNLHAPGCNAHASAPKRVAYGSSLFYLCALKSTGAYIHRNIQEPRKSHVCACLFSF